MTTVSTHPQNVSEIRARVAQLRQELAATTQRYQAARQNGRSDQVITLLRKKSTLIQQLFQAQSELLLVLRNEVKD